MNLKGAFRRAKDAVEDHGGTAALKDDFGRARKAASEPGSVKDKAMAVREAITHKPEDKRDPAADADEVAPLAEDQSPPPGR